MTTGSSPTARALQALEVLQDRSIVTAPELAERLGVTERAVRRYVAILRDAGVPIDSDRGPAGGYRLGRNARLASVVFEQAEALGLVMAVLEAHPAAADTSDPVGAALSKVIRALPERVRLQAAALRDHADAAPDRYSAHPDPQVTSLLILAVASRRTVIVAYRSESGREWDTEVDPWAVVVRRGRWYLLCRSHQADAVRTYRLDRVRSAEMTEQSFTPPADLDAVVTLEENLGTGWEYPVRISFRAPVTEVERYIHPAMGRLEADGEGCLLLGSTSNAAMYAEEWLSRIPLPFRIQEGPELRAAMTDLAARCAAAVQSAWV